MSRNRRPPEEKFYGVLEVKNSWFDGKHTVAECCCTECGKTKVVKAAKLRQGESCSCQKSRNLSEAAAKRWGKHLENKLERLLALLNEGRTQTEVAESLGVSTAAVNKFVHRHMNRVVYYELNEKSKEIIGRVG